MANPKSTDDTAFGILLTALFAIAVGRWPKLTLVPEWLPSPMVPGHACGSSQHCIRLGAISAASTAAPFDHKETAGLDARGAAYLCDGDVALARVFFRRAAERDGPRDGGGE